MKSTTIALLLLLLICTSEIVHIQAKIEHGRSKISKLNRPRRKNKDDDEDDNDKQDKEDPKGSFVADEIRKWSPNQNLILVWYSCQQAKILHLSSLI